MNTTIAKFAVGAAIGALVLTACATDGVAVNGRFPARFPDAAQYNRVAVLEFEGRNGSLVSSELAAELGSASLDGELLLDVVNESQLLANAGVRSFGNSDAQIAAALNVGRQMGVEGVYIGQVTDYDASRTSRRVQRSECLEWEGFLNCKRSREYTVSCYEETALVSAAPRLVSVATGSVVYTSTVTGRAETDWCDDRPRTISESELMGQARADVVRQIRRHVAPYNDTFTVRLKTGNDGVPEALQAQNAGAVEFGQAGRMDRACAIWQEMDALNEHQSVPLIYNMGVCAEVVGDFERATQLYARADSLLASPDSLISEALLRARSMQSGERAIN
ncbi:hypothetical protein ACWCOP_00900 [Maricaulaceae bacterium MS644]